MISCFLTARNGGGYSFFIPWKQTCSLCLKRSLCRSGFLLSGSIFFRKLHITLVTPDWQLSLSMLHTDSKICAFVNTRPGLAAR